MTIATILSLSGFKIVGTLVAPVVVVTILIARAAEPVDGDLW